MNDITMIKTPEQRNADVAREHALRMLSALQRIHATSTDGRAVDIAAEAIEYASGANDPGCSTEAGYGVDAAGTFTG